MIVSAARLNNDGELCLKVSPSTEVYRFVNDFIEGDYEIKKKHKKRSINANAYAWVLIDAISDRLRIPKEEIYKRAIREIGGVSTTVCVQNKAVEALIKSWSGNGIGWQVEKLDSKIPGCTNCVLYYGSSMYDTRQMSALIDHLIDDARLIGIETLPPEKIDLLKGEWK